MSSLVSAWIGSICSGLNFFMATLAGILVDRFGCRPTAVFGGILALIGITTSSFVHNIELMYLTYGLLMGVGFGLAFQPSLIVLGTYFRKRLGLANGIASFGASVFTIVLPLILTKIMDIGFAPCLWFESALVLLMLLAAFTFRPLPKVTQRLTHQGAYTSVEETMPTVDEDCPNTKENESLDTSNSHDVKGKKTYSKKDKNTRSCLSCGNTVDFSIWKERSYRIWTIGVIIGCFGYFVPFVHLVRNC